MTNKTFIYQMKNKPLTQSEQEGRKIELTVELDSWSPVYDSRGIKFREKIALDCFDFDAEINKQFINSYLDHKVSIEHLLASTKNKTMTVEKVDNKLIATIPVDENNLQLKKVADLISTGVIESNSFIFEPLEIEINEIENNNDLQTEIIYKKAKLISIDPVYEGFYPQDKYRVYDKNNIDTLEYLAQQKEQEMKAEELKDEVLQNTQETQNTETETKEETNELQNSTNAEVEQLNARIEELEKRNKEIEKLKNELEEQAQERFKKVKEQNAMNQTAKSYTELKDLARSGKATNEDINALNNAMIDFLSEEDKYEIRKLHPVAFDKLEKRALDATTNEKGLAVIETVQMPGVLKDWTSLFPEFTELASKYNLTGLDTLVKNIYVPDNKEITSIQEGADSTALGGKTFQVKFSPVRYSTFITQNNALTHGAELWSAQVENAKNSIRKSIRKKFWSSIFTHAAVTVPTDGTYTGGVTQEAKYTTQISRKFSWNDIDALVREIEDNYGEDKVQDFIIAMHPEVLAKLEEPFLNSTTASFINTVYDTINKKYRGLQIITTSLFPEKEFTQGKKVAVLFDKNSIVAYGLNFIIESDPYKDMSKDQINTYIRTRGEIKLVDPHVHSRFVEIKQ